MLSVYMWGYFWPMYIYRSNVFVPAGSGHYRSYLKETPFFINRVNSWPWPEDLQWIFGCRQVCLVNLWALWGSSGLHALNCLDFVRVRWIPLDVMMNPRNLPLDIPKNDLVRFIFSWWARMIRTRFSGRWDGCFCCDSWLQCRQHSIPPFFVDNHEKLFSWHVGKSHPYSSIWTALLCNSMPQ